MRTASATGIPSFSVAWVDDDRDVLRLVEKYLAPLKCSVRTFVDPAKCLAALAADGFDIVITDLRMPGMSGVELLAEVKKLSHTTEVIIVTGDADQKAAIEAVKHGAFDFFEKPVCKDMLIESVKRTVRYATAVRERDRLAEQLSMLSESEARQWGIEAMVGNSEVVRRLVGEIRKLKDFPKTSVMILGESGTGKELVARAIHYAGPRKNCPFVPLNCAAVPADLAESTLFGHTKGSFTGAWADKKGHFDMAEGGTLFLDEIGDMPQLMQAKLLRVLEDGMVMPVGGTKAHAVDVRVVAATNANLNDRVAERKFRKDLFYRISSYVLNVPPLRERRGDIPILANHFLGMFASQMGIAVHELKADALVAVQGYDYPGNVRELKNIVERALIESGGVVEARHIHFPMDADQNPGSISDQVSAATDDAPEATPEITEPEAGTFNLQVIEDSTICRA
ncbi:MAG: sigma-54 dependent transcriptional regulator, partial [bacterium]